MKLAKEQVESKFLYHPKEKDELIAFINELLDMEWEEYRAGFEQNRYEVGLRIMKFFQMPWAPLHARFRSQIIARVREEAQEKLFIRESNKIKENLVLAKKDERTRDNDSVDLNYFKVNQYDLVSGDSIVWIGIPYQRRTEKNRSDLKFAFQMCISKLANPKLFDKIMDNYPEYH